MFKSFGGKKIGFIIPVLLAGMAVFLFSLYLKTRESELGLSAELVPVIVAKKDIPAYTRLDRAMVTYVKVPRKFVQPAIIASLEDIENRISLVPLLKGSQILDTMLSGGQRSIGLALKIAKGYRAVSVGVDDINSVGGLLQAGNRVDVLGIFDFNDAANEQKLKKRTFTLIQNLIVLAVGKDMGKDTLVKEALEAKGIAALRERIGKLRNGGSGKSRRNRKKTVTLMATPAQAQKLVLAQSVGKVALTLRPVVGGEKIFQIESLDSKTMLGIREEVYIPRPWREIRGADRY